jgi:hypothetical protein
VIMTPLSREKDMQGRRGHTLCGTRNNLRRAIIAGGQSSLAIAIRSAPRVTPRVNEEVGAAPRTTWLRLRLLSQM